MGVCVEQEPVNCVFHLRRKCIGWDGTYPLNSRNLQMTFATTSSFLSNGVVDGFLIFVRAAKRSVAVAPKHNAKSIVED